MKTQLSLYWLTLQAIKTHITKWNVKLKGKEKLLMNRKEEM